MADGKYMRLGTGCCGSVLVPVLPEKRRRGRPKGVKASRPNKAATPHVCLQCGEAFVGFKSAKYCSGTCRWTFNNALIAQRRGSRPEIQCSVCGASCTQKSSLKKYCSEKCKTKERAKLFPDGGSNFIRRSRRYGVEFHRFNKVEVFERDGWKCGICGIDTPQVMRGTRAHNSPELDHVTPLSRGGKHTKENTRCSCRSCNLTKGRLTDEELFQRLAA